jgi:translation initiation factor 1
MNKNSRLVYSTDNGRIKTSSQSTSPKPNDSDGIIRIHRETKGRKGKGVSLVKGFNLTDDELKNLAKKLKQKLGVGGSVKSGIIEIQTIDRDKLKLLLDAEGFNSKIAGG